MKLDLTHDELEFIRALMNSQASSSEWRKNPLFNKVLIKVTNAVRLLETSEKMSKWLEQ